MNVFVLGCERKREDKTGVISCVHVWAFAVCWTQMIYSGERERVRERPHFKAFLLFPKWGVEINSLTEPK